MVTLTAKVRVRTRPSDSWLGVSLTALLIVNPKPEPKAPTSVRIPPSTAIKRPER